MKKRQKWVNGELVEVGATVDNRSEQQKLVDNFHDALTGEVPLQGDDSGWVMIGGIKLGTTITIKSDDGSPLFDVTLSARPRISQDFDPQAIYPVLLKRGEDGRVERVTVNFTSVMEYSNQNPSPEQALGLLAKFSKLGLMKPKDK
jgi:hypothetical protein